MYTLFISSTRWSSQSLQRLAQHAPEPEVLPSAASAIVPGTLESGFRVQPIRSKDSVRIEN